MFLLFALLVTIGLSTMDKCSDATRPSLLLDENGIESQDAVWSLIRWNKHNRETVLECPGIEQAAKELPATQAKFHITITPKDSNGKRTTKVKNEKSEARQSGGPLSSPKKRKRADENGNAQKRSKT